MYTISKSVANLRARLGGKSHIGGPPGAASGPSTGFGAAARAFRSVTAGHGWPGKGGVGFGSPGATASGVPPAAAAASRSAISVSGGLGAAGGARPAVIRVARGAPPLDGTALAAALHAVSRAHITAVGVGSERDMPPPPPHSCDDIGGALGASYDASHRSERARRTAAELVSTLSGDATAASGATLTSSDQLAVTGAAAVDMASGGGGGRPTSAGARSTSSGDGDGRSRAVANPAPQLGLVGAANPSDGGAPAAAASSPFKTPPLPQVQGSQPHNTSGRHLAASSSGVTRSANRRASVDTGVLSGLLSGNTARRLASRLTAAAGGGGHSPVERLQPPDQEAEALADAVMANLIARFGSQATNGLAGGGVAGAGGSSAGGGGTGGGGGGPQEVLVVGRGGVLHGTSRKGTHTSGGNAAADSSVRSGGAASSRRRFSLSGGTASGAGTAADPHARTASALTTAAGAAGGSVVNTGSGMMAAEDSWAARLPATSARASASMQAAAAAQPSRRSVGSQGPYSGAHGDDDSDDDVYEALQMPPPVGGSGAGSGNDRSRSGRVSPDSMAALRAVSLSGPSFMPAGGPLAARRPSSAGSSSGQPPAGQPQERSASPRAASGKARRPSRFAQEPTTQQWPKLPTASLQADSRPLYDAAARSSGGAAFVGAAGEQQGSSAPVHSGTATGQPSLPMPPAQLPPQAQVVMPRRWAPGPVKEETPAEAVAAAGLPLKLPPPPEEPSAAAAAAAAGGIAGWKLPVAPPSGLALSLPEFHVTTGLRAPPRQAQAAAAAAGPAFGKPPRGPNQPQAPSPVINWKMGSSADTAPAGYDSLALRASPLPGSRPPMGLAHTKAWGSLMRSPAASGAADATTGAASAPGASGGLGRRQGRRAGETIIDGSSDGSSMDWALALAASPRQSTAGDPMDSEPPVEPLDQAAAAGPHSLAWHRPLPAPGKQGSAAGSAAGGAPGAKSRRKFAGGLLSQEMTIEDDEALDGEQGDKGPGGQEGQSRTYGTPRLHMIHNDCR